MAGLLRVNDSTSNALHTGGISEAGTTILLND
jgi:hypothetical protein